MPTHPSPPRLTVAGFQSLIRERYHRTDAARGMPGTFMWLIEEVGELATALHEGADPTAPEAARSNLAEEFADVIAWVTTLANVAEVDLEAALTKYTDPGRVEGVKS